MTTKTIMTTIMEMETKTTMIAKIRIATTSNTMTVMMTNTTIVTTRNIMTTKMTRDPTSTTMIARYLLLFSFLLFSFLSVCLFVC